MSMRTVWAEGIQNLKREFSYLTDDQIDRGILQAVEFVHAKTGVTLTPDAPATLLAAGFNYLHMRYTNDAEMRQMLTHSITMLISTHVGGSWR